ncbi:nephrin-like [Eriocheir sinensis]|uniref:nephrin-like n=1 Tax=Eriocheir sinensis TaxID=95602 RepID=UPI0021C63C66|nr:nephrin-like [Eriocheir sinensis]
MDRRTQGRREEKKKKKKGNEQDEETEDDEEAERTSRQDEEANEADHSDGDLVAVDRPRLWWDDGRIGDRARLEVSGPGVVLRVSRLKMEDKGLYTCRVDFRLQPTKTTRVNLTVVEPPERVEIQMEGKETPLVSPGGASVTRVGPYLEGEVVRFTCVARGGSPRPRVSWRAGTRLLDAKTERDGGDLDATTNSPEAAPLTLAPARRTQHQPKEEHHLHLVLTCEATNNTSTSPVSLAIAVDMSLPPLSVHLTRVPEAPLVAGRHYPVECQVVGARPPPAVTWRIGQRPPLPQAEVTTLEGGNITRSRLSFIPGRKDDGATLTCTASTVSPNATLATAHQLAVQYMPSAWCSFGSSLDWANIKEGDDVYFECSIDANPPVTRVTWRHNDAPLGHNVSAGIIVSNQSLVLQRVVRAQAGRYSCLAHNAVGTSASNTLRLDVKFAPVCSPGQVTTYAVSRYEDAEVTCSVDANPLQESYQWTFNNTADTIDVPQGRFTSLSSHSVITYTPMTPLDYGTLLCWATNPIGTQKLPCVFHIVPAGKPEPPTNCTVLGGGVREVRVRCEAGASGGLTQHFLLTASPTHLSAPHLSNPQPLNLTALEEPEFLVEGLAVGGRYQLRVRAVNDKGMSEPAVLTVSSRSTNGTLYQLYDGPSEAEVRDGGKSPHGGEDEDEEGSDDPILGALEIPSVLAAALGAGCGLILLGLLLILLLIFRGRRRRRREGQAHQTTPSPSSSSSSLAPGRCLSLRGKGESKGRAAASRATPSRSESTAAMLSPGHGDTCLERDMQVDPESDPEPDVIPLRESSGSVVGIVGGGPATVLPPEGYTCLPPAFRAPQCLADFTYTGVDPLASSHAPVLPQGAYYPGEHLLQHSGYLHDPLQGSISPRRSPAPPPPLYQDFEPLEPRLPPPDDFLDPDRRRASGGSRQGSHEDPDTPSTPLLRRGESCV